MTVRRWLVVAVAGVVLAACGGPAEDAGVGTDDTTDGVEDGADEDGAAEVDDADAGADDADAGADDAEDDAGDDDTGEDGPQPDPAALADPCAAHEDREMDQFIDLVAPVQEQRVSGALELVGCSNVFEATVSYRLLDGDGRTLEEGFTTATCGTGCVGEFRETVDLAVAAGEPVVYLQVFTQSMADDGGEDELTEVMVVLE
jgi:hypothetical protein